MAKIKKVSAAHMARYRNSKGKIIPLHHAFLTLHVTPAQQALAALLAIGFSIIVWMCLPLVVDLWSIIFEYWTKTIFNTGVVYESYTLLTHELLIPSPDLVARYPSDSACTINGIVCAFVFIMSYYIPLRLAPLVYFLRAIILVQLSVTIAHMTLDDIVPYTLHSYVSDCIVLSLWLLTMIPLVLGFIYYIFDFSIFKKVLTTAITLLYFVVTIPMQYMFHAAVIYKGSLLFLPLMYFVFGTLMDVFAFICFYATAMSMRRDPKLLHGRS